MKSPDKLSHVVLQTNQIPVMRDWYCNVLVASTAFENDALCFLGYDDEHHRIGLVSMGEYTGHLETITGLHHISFTYDTLKTLLETHERLAADEVRPVWSINHGPTVSMYYLDPDGNRVELQVDVFDSNDDVNDFINGPIYQQNPIGVDFEPEKMLAQLREGVPAEELMRRNQ